jgi:two-component system chemotaxis sensor kinase CheA
MVESEERFLQRLLATFQVEAGEHVDAMSSLLLALEKPESPGQTEQVPALIETLYRETHSLKGAARAVNLGDIEALCQVLESVLSALKRGDMPLSATLLDLMYRSVEAVRRMLASAGRRDAVPGYEELLQALQSASLGVAANPSVAPAPN